MPIYTLEKTFNRIARLSKNQKHFDENVTNFWDALHKMCYIRTRTIHVSL